MSGTDKITRILILFYRLTRGEYINKSKFVIEHNITQRSFDRDVEDIRIFLSEIYTSNELIFDKENSAYYLTGCYQLDVSGVEILALLKILMSSRAFRKDEISGLISAICSLIPADKQKNISQLLLSEVDNYSSPNHNKAILKIQWDLGQCILKQQIIELNYYKANGEEVNRLVSPVSIVFSEYYFYLIAFRNDEKYDYPAFFRLDRIESFKMTNDKYPQKLFEQYSVGNMKNCIQFMYAGELIDVKLRCVESALESILDRLPNAKVIEKDEVYSTVAAKIFGDGFIHWVLSQGTAVEVLEPIDYREKIKKQVTDILTIYTKGKDVGNG
jgi:predicted DNA-binding transcriptional regulator YafY